MCGIIGAISYNNVSSTLLKSLLRLEYRGYDSAGIAIIDNHLKLKHLRIQGKVQALIDASNETSLDGKIGIAHTRWATHGKPCEKNAHPHVSHGELAIVHNGIIENHEILRKFLINEGYEFTSETDTEVAAHLIHYHYQNTNDLLKAVQLSAKEIKGAFAIGVIHAKHPHELIAYRKGSPLIIGIGSNEHFIASDSLALRGNAEAIIYLEDGDSARLNTSSFEIFDKDLKSTTREASTLSPDSNTANKGRYRHFMLKEIFEQPRVFSEIFEGRIQNLEILKASFGAIALEIFPKIKRIHIVACGTSYHAGFIAKYWLEDLAKIPTQVEIASEFRYRKVAIDEGTLFLTISQSGETADTLAALERAKTMNYLATMTICNIASSTLVRESDFSFLTRAGVEIGVASTKAFTSQLAALLMFATALCKTEASKEVISQLEQLPAQCAKILDMHSAIAKIATIFSTKSHTLFLGRGVHYPVALEGALKLKEISYIHAEAYPAGELKHGPLALIDSHMPVVAVAPNNDLFEKLKSNLHEVSARGGQLIVFIDENEEIDISNISSIKIPACGSWVAPILYTIPLQLLAYHVAVIKGTDVDQPRNLAKSVTVE